MARQKSAAEEPQEPEERSPLAGAVALVILGAVVFGALFAWSDAAGILAVWVASTVLGWWRVRRPVSDSSATPPPGEDRPSCRECAGHEVVGAAPLEGQKGMWIFKTTPPGRPNHTHVHLAPRDDEAHA
ncbi:hypothetical protein [Streptomyces flaveolus]|uniref:hypothetical protein n=1 Tax=Streptomyces flaveolus TaxID=67297 RepID=UPI0034399DBF